MKIVTKIGHSPGGIPLVTSTQPAHPLFKMVCQYLSYREGEELATSCE